MNNLAKRRTLNASTFVGALVVVIVIGVSASLLLFSTQMQGVDLRVAVILMLCASVTLLAPIITALKQKPYDVFHPLNFVALSFFFGVFGRSAFILSSDSPAVQELLEGRGPESVIPGSVLSMLGSILLCIGYVYAGQLKFTLRPINAFFAKMKPNFLFVFLPVIFAVCAAATYFFLKSTGFEYSGLDSLSMKRRVVINGVESSMGYYRLLAQDVPRALLLILVALWMRYEKRSRSMLIAIAGFGVLAVALPFLASSRVSVVIAVITVCVVVNRAKEIKMKTLALAFGVCVAVIFGMLALRRVTTRGASVADSMVTMGLEPLFANHSFADMVKLAHIYEAVPDLIDYKYGSSFVAVFYAPVPRVWWENKPPISMGREITEKIYNRGLELKDKGGGTPPGIFAESLINFSVYGFPIAILIIGGLLRVLTNTLSHMADQSAAGLALYGGVIPPYCLSMMGGDFTRSLVQSLAVFGIIIGFCMLSRIKVLPGRRY